MCPRVLVSSGFNWLEFVFGFWSIEGLGFRVAPCGLRVSFFEFVGFIPFLFSPPS